MPRPPIIPQLDWRHVFESGKDYDTWIASAEEPAHREQIELTRRTLILTPHLLSYLSVLQRVVHVAAFAEDWCGDVVRHVPVLQRLADEAPMLHVRYLSRARHADVFARFLTYGGESIPKFVFMNDAFVECGVWGPMPEACREQIARGKACGDIKSARQRVATLYKADPDCREVIRELVYHIDVASTLFVKGVE